MDLKKNDKIILVVGVAILIVAGIGIAVYTSPDTDEIKAGNTEPDYLSYNYNWMKDSTENFIGGDIYVEKSSTYNDNIEINSQEGSVLTSVEFEIIWEDDYTHGILRSRGEDTLTVKISAPKPDISDSTLLVIPVPIESIATTAATPIIIPSIVSQLRKPLWVKLFSDSLKTSVIFIYSCLFLSVLISFCSFRF